MTRVVVVGAGPAGIAAADVLSRAAVEVTLIDEAERPGGQYHRAPASGLQLDMRRLLDAAHASYAAFHAQAASVCARVDYRPATLVWGVHGRAVHLAARGFAQSVGYDALVLATGATDRVMPLPGWTLPGVFTLGGAQAVLKDQGCLIGRRVVFCGSSPLLYLAAVQYLRAGGKVAAVIDTTRFAEKLRALPDMLAAPGVLGQGLRHMAALKRRGVPILHGATIDAFEGKARVSAVRCTSPDSAPLRVACDAVAYGHGLRPETQLAELAGCTLRFDPVQRVHVPETDPDGRAGHAIYVAGDGGSIGGGQAAAVSGRLAAAAALHDLGLAADVDVAASRASLARLRRFQKGVAAAFRWPGERAAALDDAVILCRCENVTVGEVRAAIALQDGVADVNRAKAATRCGMGRCQGRFCGAGLAEVAAACVGGHDHGRDRLRVQTPIKPLPMALAGDLSP
ncbi:FAD/NAD(P)-dependent oxidoreductase [Falsiroseomonas oryzae]|uniref:FAD/NAD(P)-dependent oxidoreductase n=1 Tax=Falsiroseomonas oryzae TaxID=2766473 RepID=UPI0022EA3E1E|nr:NAD(P)/FAD-dependent oxidoreductase [Roseomonas sp. MO-31]